MNPSRISPRCEQKTVQDNGSSVACTRAATLKHYNSLTKTTAFYCGLHAVKLKRIGWTFETLKATS